MNGKVVVGRQNLSATHVSWFLEYSIWPNFLCHVCDNRACVRPSHLFEWDDAANRYDRDLKNAGAIVIEVP